MRGALPLSCLVGFLEESLTPTELAYDNEPLDLPLTYNLDTEGRPRFIYLPYSRVTLKWNSKLHKWEYEDHSECSLSSGSFISGSSRARSDDSPPSLTEPIEKFEVEDYV